jgi:phosphomannomutase
MMSNSEWQTMSASSRSSTIEFGTDGWRGIIADDFTFSNMQKTKPAIASYLETAYAKKRLVCFLAYQFSFTAAEILADLGRTAKPAERDLPTPVIACSAFHLNWAKALAFAVSYNPAPYCGIKDIPDYARHATSEMTDNIVASIKGATDNPPIMNNNSKIFAFYSTNDLKFIDSVVSV